MTVQQWKHSTGISPW